MFRSGLVGFTLHGSLSHYYYQFCEVITIFIYFPFNYSLLLSVLILKLTFQFTWDISSILQELFPFQDWWVVPAKVAFDQTAWAAVWNSIYFTVLGFLRLESPANIFSELKATFWPMLTVREHRGLFCVLVDVACCAGREIFKRNCGLNLYSLMSSVVQAGWKLWPFAHLITYGVIPVEQRLLWVDCVELIWVTILST